ncbi:MerR family transcriptional regulator [Vagococcus xieshaowenii]|uniref:MerR family transcriptional regulator n=1 Tax=Vagococcus xieshaowenii TaxID=2562451 RepID=A0A4Z0D7U6_9ENTE|nr:MerR family transcriptional regulator [Vagococcus xieshaowenii]QCA29068.1 MerR family transcriptional regulator [Vagococcus xieshaowenii]TFZ40956.1 MerR family transcriptional regulator [Vagococcus xieshaowenii]
MIGENVRHLLDNNHLVIGIGELSEMTGVTTRQLRYWESKGFIESQQNEHHTARNFSLVNIIKVELIKGFLDEGFTLKKSVEKAHLKMELIGNIKKIFNESFNSAEILEEKYTVISLGMFDPQQEMIYLIRDNDNGEKFYHIQRKEEAFNFSDVMASQTKKRANQ